MVGRKNISSTKRRSASSLPTERRVARRTAYVPLKHHSERITDRWARTGRKSVVDPAATMNRRSVDKLVGGISRRTARDSVYRVAKRLAIKQRATMTKRQ